MDITKKTYTLTQKELAWIIISSMNTGAVFGVTSQITEEQEREHIKEILEMFCSPNKPGARRIRKLTNDFINGPLEEEIKTFRESGNRFNKWFRPLEWDKEEPFPNIDEL